MLKKILSKLSADNEVEKKPESPAENKKYKTSKTGSQLIGSNEREKIITKIKRQVSVTEKIWEQYYLSTIKEFCEIVQELPASEIHHHSNSGGMIDHTLEAVLAGIKISQGYVIPPNSEPENIVESAEKWRYGIFISILAHDIGKIITDMDVVYRETGSHEFKTWCPWYEKIPFCSEYTYRFKNKINNSSVAKGLHEKASVSFLPKLIKKEAAIWMFEDMELISQMLNTITNSTFGGLVIADIVKKADTTSVAKNLGAQTGLALEHTNKITLPEKILTSIRKLIDDGELKKNKPGAALWVGENDTWLVSRAAMEAVRQQLAAEGHTGIPKNVVRIFEILKDHNLIVPNPEGDSVWQAEIIDPAKNWNQKLTFLRFPNTLIWPTRQPEYFDGEIVPMGEIKPNEETKESSHEKKLDEVIVNDEAEKPLDPMPMIPELETYENKIGNSENYEKRTKPQSNKKVNLEDSELLTWLMLAIEKRVIRVNEPKAPVHILDKYIALVTPVIFNTYLDKNPIKKKIYEEKSENRKVFTFLQKELESLGIHEVSKGGQNIHTVTVEGERKIAELRVYLLPRNLFPQLKSFTSNKAIKVM